MDLFQTCYAFTKGAEGGVVNNPDDPGGLTNTGLTLPDLRRFSRTATASDLMTLTDGEIQAIYLALYFLPVAGWQLPKPLALMVFDHGVAAGVGDSAMLLQGLLLVEVDGYIGSQTLAAADAVTAAEMPGFVTALSAAQGADYARKADARFFLKGWDLRLDARTTAAKALIT